MKKKTLSIVIPCYRIDKNHRYLNILLETIKNQKISAFDIEKIILVNDSPEYILEKYIDSCYINNNLIIKSNLINSGQAYSRNIGLNIVSSEFVHFIDQDDYISNDFYYNLQSDADILISKCVLTKNSMQINHASFFKHIWLRSFNKLNKLKFFLIFDNIILSPGQAVFKTQIIKNINGFPELKNYGSDDYGLIFKLAKFNYKYCYFSNSKYFHRIHDIQGKQFLNMKASRHEFLNFSNSFFNWICITELFPINILKKLLYVIFYNRF